MKELYLIPKQGYERMLSSLNTNSKVNTEVKDEKEIEWKTSIPPPTSSIRNPRQSQIPLRVIKSPEDISLNRNPSLNELLPITFKEEDLSRAKLLLKHFEKSGSFRWDNSGDLFSPFNKGNVIDIIKTWNDNKSRFTDEEIQLYRYIISVTDIPIWMIKNSQLKKLLTAKDVTKKKVKKNRMGTGLTKKINIKKWLSY